MEIKKESLFIQYIRFVISEYIQFLTLFLKLYVLLRCIVCRSSVVRVSQQNYEMSLSVSFIITRCLKHNINLRHNPGLINVMGIKKFTADRFSCHKIQIRVSQHLFEQLVANDVCAIR